MKIVSACTPEYKDEAEEFVKSCHDVGIEPHIMKLKSTGSWVRNAAKKAQAIFEALLLKEPVLWLDVDARIIDKSFLDLFRFLEISDADFAYRKRQTKNGLFESLTGTLWFNQSLGTLKFLSEWIYENERNPDAWDQQNFGTVCNSYVGNLKEFFLPTSYCFIGEIDGTLETHDPVIYHTQASRRLKHIVNGKK